MSCDCCAIFESSRLCISIFRNSALLQRLFLKNRPLRIRACSMPSLHLSPLEFQLSKSTAIHTPLLPLAKHHPCEERKLVKQLAARRKAKGGQGQINFKFGLCRVALLFYSSDRMESIIIMAVVAQKQFCTLVASAKQV